jgi:hypothetical protein
LSLAGGYSQAPHPVIVQTAILYLVHMVYRNLQSKCSVGQKEPLSVHGPSDRVADDIRLEAAKPLKHIAHLSLR